MGERETNGPSSLPLPPEAERRSSPAGLSPIGQGLSAFFAKIATDWPDTGRTDDVPYQDKGEAEIVDSEPVLARSSGIPPRFFRSDLSKLLKHKGNQAAIGLAEQMIAQRTSGKGLFLYGPVGTGKTSIASAVALAYLKQRRTVRFLSMNALLAQLKESFRDDSGVKENELLKQWANQGLFVLDDLGAERGTEWARSAIVPVIERLYNAVTTMIVTSNLTPDEFRQTYDRRVASRLVEMMTFVEVAGSDYRMRVGRS